MVGNILRAGTDNYRIVTRHCDKRTGAAAAVGGLVVAVALTRIHLVRSLGFPSCSRNVGRAVKICGWSTVGMAWVFSLDCIFRRPDNTKLAQAYFNRGYLKEATEVTEEIDDATTGAGEAFYAKIAQAYLNKGELEKATEVTRNIVFDAEAKKEALYHKIAQAYIDRGDLKNAAEIT